MTQPRSSVSTCAAQWKMWLIKVFGVICFTAFCAAQDSENVTSVLRHVTPTTLMPEATVTPAVYEASLHLTSSWSEVFPSEKVELTCNISGGSDWTIFWYRDDKEIQKTTSNVALSADGSELTLTAEKSYSGKYSCEGVQKSNVSTPRSNQVDVKVYDSPIPTISKNPNIDMMFSGESVTFTCTVGVLSGWEYVWYHNEKEITVTSTNEYTIDSVDHSKSGQYGCKARRGKDPFYTTKTMASLQISDPPTPSLKLLSPWSDVFESERVEFSCNLNSSDWTFTWYRNNEKFQGGINEDGSSLNITSVTRSHQGLYTCKAHHKTRNVASGISNTANIVVYENRPTPTLRRNYGFKSMYVGETVNFTCTVDVASGWEYRWYKDQKLLTSGSTYSITLRSSDGGKYSCRAIRGGTTTTKEITQHVLEIPVPSLKQSTQWLDVFPNERVKLTCEIKDGSDWTYTWHKDEKQIQADNTVSFESNGAILTISSASATHNGLYKCKGQIHSRPVYTELSSGLKISVHDKTPSVILTQDPEYDIMFSGESVNFSCHINVSSGWEYLWYKDESPLNAPLKMYKIDPVQISSKGLYKCRAKRGSDQPFHTDYSQIKDLDIRDKKPKPSVTRQPNTNKVYNGESVSFECKVTISSGWDYEWYKDGSTIHSHSSRLDIHNATGTANGTYECMATRTKTMYQTEHSDEQVLHISEIPVPLLKRGSQWLDVFPTETVKLSCGISSGRSEWSYTWYKDGQEVQADNTVSFVPDTSTLSIASTSASHHGNYSCTGKFKSRPVHSSFSTKVPLHVYDAKPKVLLTQTPNHKLMHTGDSVSFICHNNVSSGWKYVWYKDDSQLHESGHNYTISSVATIHSGSYKCEVKRGEQAVFHSDKTEALSISVKERPQAEITLLTGWSEVFSTDTLVLKCEVLKSQDMWNYTWFKGGQPISQLPSERYDVKPEDDPEQSLYTCQGIRTGRPSYSKPSDSFKTKNLLLKRRVLLSISGCIFFGIIAVFLGCIVLRVLHKPADNEDNLEEANLFLTMAQLKNCPDAPCPLVDYVTEEALNAPAKEEGENGIICSETTPLPISTQEDQAVTTENSDKEENNGGLASFKQ